MASELSITKNLLSYLKEEHNTFSLYKEDAEKDQDTAYVNYYDGVIDTLEMLTEWIENHE